MPRPGKSLAALLPNAFAVALQRYLTATKRSNSDDYLHIVVFPERRILAELEAPGRRSRAAAADSAVVLIPRVSEVFRGRGLRREVGERGIRRAVVEAEPALGGARGVRDDHHFRPTDRDGGT